MMALLRRLADGQPVASIAADFTADGTGQGQASTSEQSVSVSECKAFIVNNFIGDQSINHDSTVSCIYANAGGGWQAMVQRCDQLIAGRESLGRVRSLSHISIVVVKLYIQRSEGARMCFVVCALLISEGRLGNRRWKLSCARASS